MNKLVPKVVYYQMR